jgi:hypothetical protein
MHESDMNRDFDEPVESTAPLEKRSLQQVNQYMFAFRTQTTSVGAFFVDKYLVGSRGACGCDLRRLLKTLRYTPTATKAPDQT